MRSALTASGLGLVTLVACAPQTLEAPAPIVQAPIVLEVPAIIEPDPQEAEAALLADVAASSTSAALDPVPPCPDDLRLRFGRLPFSAEAVDRATRTIRAPLHAALCVCGVTSASALVAVTPSRGTLEVSSGLAAAEAWCVRAHLPSPAFEPFTLAADCPTCAAPLTGFRAAPVPPPPPDGTLFVHVSR